MEQQRMNSKRIDRRDRNNGIQYWAFLGNPKYYDIEGAVQLLTEDVWLTRGHDVRKGDMAVIWKAKGGTPMRGVIAFAEIITDPDSDIPFDPAFWKVESRIHGSELHVRVRYHMSTSLPLLGRRYWQRDLGHPHRAKLDGWIDLPSYSRAMDRTCATCWNIYDGNVASRIGC